jgi:hypothetical protein
VVVGDGGEETERGVVVGPAADVAEATRAL